MPERIGERSYDNFIDGWCPMGCGETLYRTDEGRIECGLGIDCPDETAMRKILTAAEAEHVVQVGTFGWTIRHPLRERIGDALMLCDLNEYMAGYSPGARIPGEYLALKCVNGWELMTR